MRIVLRIILAEYVPNLVFCLVYVDDSQSLGKWLVVGGSVALIKPTYLGVSYLLVSKTIQSQL